MLHCSWVARQGEQHFSVARDNAECWLRVEQGVFLWWTQNKRQTYLEKNSPLCWNGCTQHRLLKEGGLQHFNSSHGVLPWDDLKCDFHQDAVNIALLHLYIISNIFSLMLSSLTCAGLVYQLPSCCRPRIGRLFWECHEGRLWAFIFLVYAVDKPQSVACIVLKLISIVNLANKCFRIQYVESVHNVCNMLDKFL